jgi:hypothetical protein
MWQILQIQQLFCSTKQAKKFKKKNLFNFLTYDLEDKMLSHMFLSILCRYRNLNKKVLTFIET